jgi:hypothetical protein
MIKTNFKIILEKLNLKFKKIYKINKQFFINNLYLTFLKRVCEAKAKKESNRNKLKDIDEVYTLNSRNKIFKKFIIATEKLQNLRAVEMRRKIIMRIMFKIMLNHHVSLIFNFSFLLFLNKNILGNYI